ncbi:hypothetical protein [Bradyrhizobium diazoefficiens]
MSDDSLVRNAAAQALGLIEPVSSDKTHYEALGRFLAAFANAEGASHVLARKLSGLSDEKARLLFSGMRLSDIVERIRGLVHAERIAKIGLPDEILTDIENCLDQLGQISSRRHNLVHRGATYFSGALISANSMIAKTIASIETDIIEEKTLNDMQLDCGAIFLRFVYIAKDDSQDSEWLSALRLRSWHYKPSSKNKNPKRPSEPTARSQQSHASRASRRREAMQKDRSS